jgi:hypothetical protein
MPRQYTVTFANVAVSAAQDLVLITGATGKMMVILRCWCGVTDVSLASGQGVQVRCRFLPATVTPGTGGTTGITPAKVDPGDAACSSSTAGTNNTVQATTSGTAIVLNQDGFHLYSGWSWTPPSSIAIGPSEAFTFEMLSTPSGTVHLSGGVLFQESGG